MEDNEALRIQEEGKDRDKDQMSLSSEKPIKDIKTIFKEQTKEIKIVYDVILVFNEYKNRLDKYFEIDGKIVYDRFGKELTAKLVADKLIARGILVEIKSVELF